ncbi:Uncharacterised protein [Yersinia nurmii]|uniref:Uncharacterized protein n=1 Tax=Yersinia nurmii TaxID=685706 RepID=A0ABP1YC08_9GAMM|nr:Uncharacterised protein [Yersinia nurmii]
MNQLCVGQPQDVHLQKLVSGVLQSGRLINPEIYSSVMFR